jgi:hypothetical protein
MAVNHQLFVIAICFPKYIDQKCELINFCLFIFKTVPLAYL